MSRWATIFLLAAAGGCASAKWDREVVEAGGRHATAQLHVDGSSKALTIVHENEATGRVRSARRTGTGAGWGSFEFLTIDSDDARLPATAKAPDGTVWTAFVTGGTPTRGTLKVAHYAPGPPGNPWRQEVVAEVGIVEPPAIAIRPVSGPDEIHVVISLHPYKILRHWTRKMDEEEWTQRDLPGHELTDDEEGLGLHPRLVVSGDNSTVSLFYGQGIDGRPLVVRPGFGSAHLVSGPASEAMRFAVGVVPPPHEDAGHVALARASCEGKPRYRTSQTPVPPGWNSAHTPPTPTDESRTYCDPSFAIDAAAIVYLATYDMQVEAPVAFIHNPLANTWRVEFIDGGPDDTGRFTATTHDPLAAEILVTYHNATTNELHLATRGAN